MKTKLSNQRKAALAIAELFANLPPGDPQSRKANQILDRYCKSASQAQEDAILTTAEKMSDLLQKAGIAA